MPVPRWAIFNALALVFSSVHFVLDWHIGLFGDRSDLVSVEQAVLVWVAAAIWGAWLVAAVAAARAVGWGFAVLVVIPFVWAALGNGIPIAFCPPPCAGAFPHQDIAHVGSLVFGVLAAVTAWRAGRAAGMAGRAVIVAAATMVVAIAVLFWVQTALAYG